MSDLLDHFLGVLFWQKNKSCEALDLSCSWYTVYCLYSKNKSLSAVLLGGGAARRGTERPGMKKVLLGESEVFKNTSDKFMISDLYEQNVNKK